MRTSASAATKNGSSLRARNSRRRRKNRLSGKICRSEEEGHTTSRLPLVVRRWQATKGQRQTTALMKRIRYSKYVPDPAGEMSMEDLLGALSDFLLQSGFQNYLYDDFGDGQQTLDELRR